MFRCPISLMPISLSSLSPSPVTLSKLLMFAPWNTSEYFSMLMYRSHSSTDWNSCWRFTSNLQHKYWTSHLLLGVFVKGPYAIYVRPYHQKKKVSSVYSKKISNKLPRNNFNYTITYIPRTLRLVAIYDLLEDRHINVATVTFFTSLLYKTDRFHVAERLFNLFTFWDSLLNRRTVTWNLFVH